MAIKKPANDDVKRVPIMTSNSFI